MNDFVTPVLRALDGLDQPLDLFICVICWVM